MTDLASLTAADHAAGIHRQVVAGVIVHDGAVLLLRRRHDDFLAGLWELPSGRVEPGEDLHTALCREVQEETGLTVTTISHYLGSFDYTSGSGRLTRQHNWRVETADAANPTLTEHDAYQWHLLDDQEPPVSPEVGRILGVTT
ncbi:NUDIX domain-containing protein [Actinoalloteichus fjordicus]|uniref:8-oxo-dGTP diphosphatase n=1 Tax=Actinoalloteichus fjordicus TaxID=1612552 RepID=A0AAC9PU96_9PSEU|nr:NUDIX domain-containing protein [Actinoalloteichus fjordicus]APU17464.1 NUDIX family protein [Actinoalloteichus fjordicus]